MLWAGTVSQILPDLLRLHQNSACFATDTSLYAANVDVLDIFNVFFTVIPAFVPVHKVQGFHPFTARTRVYGLMARIILRCCRSVM